jgi:uncharacterized phage protein gp47/JayE
MALPVVGQARYPTPTEILNQMLADLRFGFARRGIAVNLLPDGDHYRRCKVVADRLSIGIANGKLALVDFSPLTATGDALEAICEVFGVSRRPAASAAGYLKVYGTNNTTITIPAAYRCTSPSGHKYDVIDATVVTLKGLVDTAGIVTPTVQVRAVGTGAATDQDAGVTVTWDSASIGALKPTAKVDPGGIDGGAEADNDETLRQRLLRKLSSPGAGGNSAFVANLAEQSSAAIEAAYVYPAVRGAGSYDVALTKAGTDRELADATVDIASAAVQADMPGWADANVTACTPEYADVIIDLALPLPASAGGSGGGWRDAAPWPTTEDSSVAGVPVKVTAIGANQITVNSTSSDPPTAGDHFGIWNPTDQEMVEFEVISRSGVSGAYLVNLQSLPTWVTTGMYISAGCVNLTAYGESFLAQMNLLGPGEKTTSAALLPRARRHPVQDAANPSRLTTVQLGAVSAEHSEIIDISYAARYATGTTSTLTTPSVPATTADPPNILAIQNLAFRASV